MMVPPAMSITGLLTIIAGSIEVIFQWMPYYGEWWF